MDDYVHISHIDGQTIGSVWTTFQLNASAKARLASPADEKSVGENSCKVTDQRGPPGPHPWSAFSPQMNEEWSFLLQMNVKLISPKYKRFPSPSSILSPESDGWIFHVPRDRPTGRGGCSCQVLADPGRPELAHDGHQVDQANPPLPASCSSHSRFRLACRGRDSSTAYLPVTVFIQDINDNPPIFQSKGFKSRSMNTFQGSCLSIHATSIVDLLLKLFLFSFFP